MHLMVSTMRARTSAMREELEELVSSLLYEGYALYPYTPGATKNATPTPFGIAYPPAYAAECAGAFDRAALECVSAAPSGGDILAAPKRALCALEVIGIIATAMRPIPRRRMHFSIGVKCTAKDLPNLLLVTVDRP